MEKIIYCKSIDILIEDICNHLALCNNPNHNDFLDSLELIKVISSEFTKKSKHYLDLQCTKCDFIFRIYKRIYKDFFNKEENIKNVLLRKAIKDNLSIDLLKSEFTGHCYIASEAYYHLCNKVNLTPMNIKHENVQHWFLKDSHGNIIDITADQFKTNVSYHKARGRGFLTKEPSKRAQILINKVNECLKKY